MKKKITGDTIWFNVTFEKKAYTDSVGMITRQYINLTVQAIISFMPVTELLNAYKLKTKNIAETIHFSKENAYSTPVYIYSNTLKYSGRKSKSKTIQVDYAKIRANKVLNRVV